MNIKKITLFFASCLMAVVGIFLLNNSPKEQYFPRISNAFDQANQQYAGAAEYWRTIRNNKETGLISTADVLGAKSQASKMRKGNKALDINWRFRGPDNVGGRTRALLIDNQDSTHLYAGSVSGGLWESFDEGLSWSAYDDNFSVVNISCIGQAADGTVLVGTGAGHDGGSNTKEIGSRFVGSGLYKLTGAGTYQELVAPVASLNYFVEWSTINEIAIDPNNSQRYLVAMNRGLRESIDGGLTWTTPIPLTLACDDVQMSDDGKILATFTNTIYSSQDNGVTWANQSFSSTSRIEVAIAPSNSNIIYAGMAGSSPLNSCTRGVFRSKDGGVSWEEIPNVPNYFLSVGCQGGYDNAIAVYPDDPSKIIVAGVSVWRWIQSSVDPAPPTGEWKVMATRFEFNGSGGRNLVYVHSDQHVLAFDPKNSNRLFIGSDGGVGYSGDMNAVTPTYGQYNFGYNVTQFYDIGIGPNDQVLGGTQDNGSPLIGLGFNTGKSSLEARGGDGFDSELFTINPTLGISTSTNGDLLRLQGVGTTLGASTINNANVFSEQLLNICSDPNDPNCSPEFFTTVAKWESFHDANTKDSVEIVISKTELPPLPIGTRVQYESKNNSIPLQDTLVADLFPRDTSGSALNKLDTLRIGIPVSGIRTFINAFDTITVDRNAQTVEFRHRGKAANTMTFNFGTRLSYENVFYKTSMLSILVTSDSNFIEYVDPKITFNYAIELPDSVQSAVALFNVRGPDATNGGQRARRNIWMSKDILKGSSVNFPRWILIASDESRTPRVINGVDSFAPLPTATGVLTLCGTFSPDGDHLFYGTSDGRVYRVDSINNIDVSNTFDKLDANGQVIRRQVNYTVNEITRLRLIGSFGRAVTGIAVDPNNGDNIIVTLGNYGGAAAYIERSTNATSAGVVQFTRIGGAGSNALPAAPIYEAVIDHKNKDIVLLATELGVFATENAFETTTVVDNGQNVVDVRWTEENTGLGRIPILSIKQMTFGPNEGAINEGIIYIGTHGRGIYQIDKLVGLQDNLIDNRNKIQKDQLVVYPNPVVNEMKIEIDSKLTDKVNIQIYTISGQLVREMRESLVVGSNIISLEMGELERGTYIVRTIQNGITSTGKFIKQ